MAQLSQRSQRSTVQHTPSTQWPVMHSASAAHEPPRRSKTHTDDLTLTAVIFPRARSNASDRLPSTGG